jgi:hypothetical protein
MEIATTPFIETKKYSYKLLFLYIKKAKGMTRDKLIKEKYIKLLYFIMLTQELILCKYPTSPAEEKLWDKEYWNLRNSIGFIKA